MRCLPGAAGQGPRCLRLSGKWMFLTTHALHSPRTPYWSSFFFISGQSSITDWLSQVSSTTPSSDQHRFQSAIRIPSTPPSTSSPRPLSPHISAPPTSAPHTPHTSPLSRKRKRAASDTCIRSEKHGRVRPAIQPVIHPLTRRALAELTAVMAPPHENNPTTPSGSNKVRSKALLCCLNPLMGQADINADVRSSHLLK